VNTDASWPTAEEAKARVLRIQTKLHQWATDDPNRRFDDLYNLVYDPAVLVDAWTRVRSNRGARSAGVDGRTAHHITTIVGEQGFLTELREDLKARRFKIPGRADPLAVGHTDGEGPPETTLNELVESRMLGNGHVRFGGAGRGNSRPRGRRRAPARLSRVAHRAGLEDRRVAADADRVADGRVDLRACQRRGGRDP